MDLTSIPELPRYVVIVFLSLSLLLGDILKRFGAAAWVIPANVLLGIALVVGRHHHNFDALVLGAALGLATTGTHRALKQVRLRS